MVPGTDPFVQMFFNENRFDREVQWAGFGFQVWLQMMTHLRRGKEDSILVIDEPDIYLHPDLQKKLLGAIKTRYRQFVMATHAAEIINEAETNEISIIEPRYKTNRRMKNEEEYPDILRYIGSSENAIFARLAKAKRVLFVEGNDIKLLRRFGGRLNLHGMSKIDSLSIIKLNGFSQWRRAVDSVWAFKNIAKLDIKAFCLFDRDYRSDEEVDDFVREMKENDVICRVLGRKEIENYLLDESVLAKIIQKRIKNSVGVDEAREFFASCTEPLKTQVSSQRMANEIAILEKKRRSIDKGTVIKRFTDDFDFSWTT